MSSIVAIAALACPIDFAGAQVQRPSLPDTRSWQRVDTGAFTQRASGEVVIPPESLRAFRSILRDGAVRLEAPLVSITTGATTLTLELSIDADPGLTCTRNGCEGTVHISLLETSRPFDRIALPSSIPIDLYGIDSVVPSSIVLTATRTLHAVRVRSRTQPATLTIHPVGLPSLDVPLPVRTVQLRMTPGTRTLDAWGLEKTTLNIARVQGLDPSDTVEIRLQGSGVRVEPSRLLVSAASGATAEIRSRELGEGVITAQGPEYVQDAEEHVQVAPPWLFLLFTLAGGLVGAWGREGVREAGARGWGLVAQVAAVGAIGALLAIGITMGVNLTPLPIPTGIVSEFMGAFAASAIAFLVDPIFDRLGGAKKDKPAAPSKQKPPTHQPA